MKSSSDRKGRSSNKQQSQKQSGEQRPSGRQQEAASGAGGQYGEGNYAATRQYNEGMKEHMDKHDVEREARDAAPRSASEENEMLDAEREGRSRAKGENKSPDSPDDLSR